MRTLLVAGMALAAAACGPLVQVGGNSTPPDMVLTLRAQPQPQAVGASGATPLRVALPAVPGELRTLRIPVATTDTGFQYLVGDAWVEQPNVMFRQLLVEVIAARTGVLVIDDRTPGLAPAQLLSGQLATFGLDVRAGQPVARVRYRALLTATGTPTRARTFEAEAPAASDRPADAAMALNAAANRVAADVADWTRSPG